MRTIKEIVRRSIAPGELDRLLSFSRECGKRFRLQHRIVREFDFGGWSLKRAEIFNTELFRCAFGNTALDGALLGELEGVETDFRRAGLTESDILWSSLTGASFREATADRLYCFKTDLSDAVFCDARLAGASFVQCNLSRADFSGAVLAQVQFTDCVLDGVKGVRKRSVLYEPVMFSGRTW